MNKVVLISCVKTKRKEACPAGEMYISPLFRMNLEYARLLKPDKIFILSAKYGLLELNQKIEPYNETLNSKNKREKKEWAAEVFNELSKKVDISKTQFIFLAGINYREYLLLRLNQFEIPMQGLVIGKQLQFLRGKIG